MGKGQPRKGMRGIYHSPFYGDVAFKVDSVEGNLCYATYEHEKLSGNPAPFIWKFHDGELNSLHDWTEQS
jgi:hypothetical protein